MPFFLIILRPLFLLLVAFSPFLTQFVYRVSLIVFRSLKLKFVLFLMYRSMSKLAFIIAVGSKYI